VNRTVVVAREVVETTDDWGVLITVELGAGRDDNTDLTEETEEEETIEETTNKEAEVGIGAG